MTKARNCVGAVLHELPPEILAQIVSHIETARALSQLSLTCKRIHAFIEIDGFRIFSQARFPYADFPAAHGLLFWRDAAHGLTTLARNWERKAFIARDTNPRNNSTDGERRQRGRRNYVRHSQTMGFVPILDSYETWYGDKWTSRKEVVSWAEGANLTVRVKKIGNAAYDHSGATNNRNAINLDVHHHEYQWMNYHAPGALEGRDDITSVSLLPQEGFDGPEVVIVGRASGGLACINLSQGLPGGQIECTYVTQGRPIRSATTNGQSLLEACLSDSAVALYSLSSGESEVTPITETSTTPSGYGRTWSSKFLSHDRLAVGCGAVKQPLMVYNLGRGELTSENMITMGFQDPDANARLDTKDASDCSATSVYSIAPIPTSALAGTADGKVFLSGAYDGSIRLHDIRSPEATVAVFRDPVDTFSPIYSLLPVGSERFVAGGGRHSIIKVFDLRLPGGKLYHATDLDPCSTARHGMPKRRNLKQHAGCCEYHYEAKHSRRGWNVFLEPGNKSKRNQTSPVYSLSRPSQCSPSFFAGIESTVLQLDMVSIMDQHPDPVFSNRPAAIRDMPSTNGVMQDAIERRWNSQGDAASLPMYEHDDGPVNLLMQQDVGHVKGAIEGWDERWSCHRSYRWIVRPSEIRT